MIEYQDMLKRIDYLDELYNKESDGIRLQMIAKLTALEIGGWLEEFFDKKLMDYINKTKSECSNELKKEIDVVYNFSYKDLRKLIIRIIGTVMIYDIEKNNEKEKQLLSSSLSKIKAERDKAAHTSVSINTSLAAPSFLKQEFTTAYTNAMRIFSALETVYQ